MVADHQMFCCCFWWHPFNVMLKQSIALCCDSFCFQLFKKTHIHPLHNSTFALSVQWHHAVTTHIPLFCWCRLKKKTAFTTRLLFLSEWSSPTAGAFSSMSLPGLLRRRRRRLISPQGTVWWISLKVLHRVTLGGGGRSPCSSAVNHPSSLQRSLEGNK